jgi:hypothetical protein
VKSYHAALIGAAVVSALAACGGGGSGTPGPGPNPNPSPAGSFRPANNGDSFHYGGTLVETFWRPVQPGPSKAPSPVPTSTTNWTVDNLTTVATNTSFHGTSGLTDFAENETDTGLQTITTVTDDYFIFPSGGAGPLIEDGYRSLDSNFVLNDVQRSASSGIVDMLPETAGASWSDTALRTSVETDPDGQTLTRYVNPDGSYSETDAFPDGTLNSAVANPDGSGLYKVLKGTSFETDYTYTAPAGGFVTITVTQPSATPMPTPTVFTVPNWQPAAGGLSSDSYVDNGIVAVPAGCALPSKFGTQGYDVAEHRIAVDPIFGTIEDVTAHAYIVQGRGVACVTRHDSLTAYYDFTGQNGLVFFAGIPLQYTIFDETISLRAESVLSSREHRPAFVIARGAARLVNAMRMHAARAVQAAARRAHSATDGQIRSQ